MIRWMRRTYCALRLAEAALDLAALRAERWRLVHEDTVIDPWLEAAIDLAEMRERDAREAYAAVRGGR